LRRCLLAAALAVCALAALAPAAGAEIATVFGGEVACSAQPGGVRFCGSSEPRSTAKSWDGTPLDVNVAFPAQGDGPFPAVMLFHGYGGEKLGLSEMQRWLDRGYAAFSMTDRGFHQSCGTVESRAVDPSGCANGYIHLMDDRYEVRDAQYLIGRLVDEGRVDPARIGALGGSYGGGMSMALAALRNRVMMPDGSLVPWTTQKGTPISLAAAAPNVPWTDLAASLVPNGSTLDYVADAPYKGRIGVEKQSLVTGLYAEGCSAGYCAPAGADPSADLTGWKAMLDAGEPYDSNPAAQGLVAEITAHHSSYYIDHSIPPAPLLISNGFTDDLFPVDEAIRFYNRTRSQYDQSQAPISMFFGDFGHPRAQNKPDAIQALEQRTFEWFDHYVKGGGPQPFQGVEAMTLTCPKSAPSGGPYLANTWAQLAPGEVRFEDKRTKTVQPGSGQAGSIFDPAFGKGACATAPSLDDSGAATYRLPPAPSGGFTLMGSPTVIADFLETDPNSQVAARLLDVAPDETETLVARGLWRPAVGQQATRQVFQLHPDGYRFEAGHIAKLELIAADSPYGRASNGQQPIQVSNLQLRLPVVERPGTGNGFVGAPAPKLVPPGYQLADQYKLPNPGPKPVKPVRLAGARLLVHILCPKAWDGCDQGVLRIHGAARNVKRLAGTGTFTRIDGGSTKLIAIPLRGWARHYLATARHPGVRITITVSERVEPTIVARSVKRPPHRRRHHHHRHHHHHRRHHHKHHHRHHHRRHHHKHRHRHHHHGAGHHHRRG
jgi:predicted acyl esterase